MTDSVDDKFDDFDLEQVFDDFDEKQSPTSLPKLAPRDSKKKSPDDLFDFNEKDYSAPKVNPKRTKTRKKIQPIQKTMYDYASAVSYKHRQYYSSWNNTTTTKTIVKGQKRSLVDDPSSSSMSKNSKIVKFNNKPSTPPDFIDNLLKYLDERSHFKVKKPTEDATTIKIDNVKIKGK